MASAAGDVSTYESDCDSSTVTVSQSSEDDDHDLEPLAPPYVANETAVPRTSHEERRTNGLQWCQCTNCAVMPTNLECLCCAEIDAIRRKLADINPQIQCLTDHPGFQSVCLEEWVLEMSHHGYQEQYGRIFRNMSPEEKWRHTAYRNAARWIWGRCGKNCRKVLPSCIVVKIRSKFTSQTYKGFKTASRF